MRRESNHNLMIWLLALMVVLAPMQAAVSAIDMLDHTPTQQQHCQMDMPEQIDMLEQMDHDNMDHGDCCSHDGACADNCSSCTQCSSVHAMLLGQFAIQNQTNRLFDDQVTYLSHGIPILSEYRPPRFFS